DRPRPEGRQMTRVEFITVLRRGLKGLAEESTSGIVADYENYFDDGRRAGRSEEQISVALGDPARLAAELRLEADAASWRKSRTRSAGFRTVAGALALLALDGLLLLPLALFSLLVAAGFVIAALAILYGAFTLTYGLFDDPAGGVLAAFLYGLGRASGGLAGIAVCLLLTGWLADFCARYVLLHRRVLRPGAIRPSTTGSPSHESH
ncbi:MAG TPA: DUF1700 domain-containing protein, partial [Steroidobacteraceae bacterium]